MDWALFCSREGIGVFADGMGALLKGYGEGTTCRRIGSSPVPGKGEGLLAAKWGS